jgi:pyruvate kinase
MDVARLNFSHAGQGEVAQLVERIRGIDVEGRRAAILVDLQGLKLRIGELATPLLLHEGDRLVLTASGAGGDGVVEADPEAFSASVVGGSRIYLKDGTIELEVVARSESGIETVVRDGGALTSRAGLNIPTLDLGVSSLTPRDREDLAFAASLEVEWAGLSFVGDARGVEVARGVLAEQGADGVRLVAKIERRVALQHLDAIAEAAEALMVARGDLGVEVGVETVPIWQRRIIAAGRRRGVPVIVATEMLESMRTHERPTRAEASDVANAVWDGASALMLSAETAIGDYPVESVATMDRIIRAAEAEADRSSR